MKLENYENLLQQRDVELATHHDGTKCFKTLHIAKCRRRQWRAGIMVTDLDSRGQGSSHQRPMRCVTVGQDSIRIVSLSTQAILMLGVTLRSTKKTGISASLMYY